MYVWVNGSYAGATEDREFKFGSHVPTFVHTIAANLSLWLARACRHPRGLSPFASTRVVHYSM
jgi:hypothetical protein